MGFQIRGHDYEIDREKITEAIKGVAPNLTDERHKYFVEISGVRYPIKQAIHLVTGLPHIAFTAGDAHRILSKLNFDVRDLRGSGAVGPTGSTPVANAMKFAVILETDEDGFVVASCPSLPGCNSQGRSREEAIANIREAIRGYVASLRKHEEPIPVIVGVVEVEVAV